MARDKMVAELAPAESQFASDSRLVEQLAVESTASALNVRREALRQRRLALDARREALARDLAGYNERLTSALMQTAGPAINAEERARRCSILFSREYLLNVADTTLDITGGVIARLNAAGQALSPRVLPSQSKSKL